jgi:hypothetical protein
MPGTMNFTYDDVNDIVIAAPQWNIRSKEDCEVWYKQWESHLATFGRKVDCIMILDDFHVDARIASEWGEYRAKINNDHIRYSFRVNADPTVRLFVQTSGIRFNAASGEAPTVEGAIEGILDARKKAKD